jgi:hypothetical protein
MVSQLRINLRIITIDVYYFIFLGDEYAVIWDPDLVPSTDNYEPYDYDSQDKPIELDRSVEREDIIEVVLDIAAQNLTGDMSNLHLALADLLGTSDPEVSHLAGLISQELDAPKTGKHPITNEELSSYRVNLLKERYPDFMMRERYKSYPSKKTIGIFIKHCCLILIIEIYLYLSRTIISISSTCNYSMA